ncbi:hypothetical protein KY284_010571 [Solanum tuberosum]|nr:hypothetical protein KY284_010571 [Solanum tuberosum]
MLSHSKSRINISPHSPLELELGLLNALLLSSELNYFSSDAFDQMEGWMLAFSDSFGHSFFTCSLWLES